MAEKEQRLSRIADVIANVTPKSDRTMAARRLGLSPATI